MNKDFTVGLGIAIAFVLMPGSCVQATEPVTFSCTLQAGTLVTMVRTAQGELPLIAWDAPEIQQGTTPPEKRCEEVSQRLQDAYHRDRLLFLTTSRINGETVVCLAQGDGEPCQQNLFTLTPQSKPRSALQRIARIRVPAAGPISETEAPIYINLADYVQGKYPQLPVRRRNTDPMLR